jgi:hypothetical protein
MSQAAKHEHPEAGYETAFSPGEIVIDTAGLQWKVVRYDIPEPGVRYISVAVFRPCPIVLRAGSVVLFLPRWIVKQCDRRRKKS